MFLEDMNLLLQIEVCVKLSVKGVTPTRGEGETMVTP